MVAPREIIGMRLRRARIGRRIGERRQFVLRAEGIDVEGGSGRRDKCAQYQQRHHGTHGRISKDVSRSSAVSDARDHVAAHCP